ncbi:MAG: FIST N-terminal domain-containing protein [Patescibacteria group bacterium]|jgi:hypothetical protein
MAYFFSSVGHSKNINAHRAGQQAAQEALTGLHGKTANLVIVFSSVVFNQVAMLAGVRSVTGEVPLVGCSSAGEIITTGPSNKSVVVMLLAADTVTFNIGAGLAIEKNAFLAGKQFAESLIQQTTQGKVAMVLPDGLKGDGADIVRGVQTVFGTQFLMAGGAAGDDFLFKETYQYFNQQVHSGAVVGTLMSGDVKFGIGVRHGWKPIGRLHRVTKVQGATILEIDDQPAINIYEELFGKQVVDITTSPFARIAITYPLGIKVNDTAQEYLLRAPFSVDNKGAITCAATVPKQAEIRLMIGGKDEAIAAARLAAQQCLVGIQQRGGKKITTAIIFNCIARNKVLAQDAKVEIAAIREVLGRDVQMIGFYTYGEQAPIDFCDEQQSLARHSEFCNETVVILGFGE